MFNLGDELEELAGGISAWPAWTCYNCGMVFEAGKPETCPHDAVGCNEILAETDCESVSYRS